MKIQIITTGDKIEMVNHFISLALDSAKNNERFQDLTGITEKDLVKVELFRKQLLRGYFKEFKSK